MKGGHAHCRWISAIRGPCYPTGWGLSQPSAFSHLGWILEIGRSYAGGSNHHGGRGLHHNSAGRLYSKTYLGIGLGIVGPKACEGLGPCLAKLIIHGPLVAFEQRDALVHAADWGLCVIYLHGLAHLGAITLVRKFSRLTSDNHWGQV
jgi:hypothetical protein